MGSCQLGQLCSLILREHFGEIVCKIGTQLFKFGPQTLPKLLIKTQLSIEHLKYGLCILIQYGFVTYTKSLLPKRALYKLFPERIILMLRYPRYLLHIKTKFSDQAEMLVEEIFRAGSDTGPRILLKVANRIRESDPDAKIDIVSLRDTFINLINGKYLMRCPKCVQDENDRFIPILLTSEIHEMYQPPKLDMTALALSVKNKKSTLPKEYPDSDVFWCVNFNRFHQDFRDELMISTIKRRIDEPAGQLMKYLLELMYIRTEPWVTTSNPIPYSELKETIRRTNGGGHPELVQNLDQYLSLIVEDSSKFVQRTGEGSGGQYVVDIKEGITQLTWSTIENIVLERFGNKSARIFRLIRDKRYADQEQIKKVAMIPDKEAKEHTYRLLEENFLKTQEFNKSSVPIGQLNKCFFYFWIDINMLTRNLQENYYKAIYNIITSAETSSQENKHILDKKQRIDTIVLSLREQDATQEQITEIEEMMSPPETQLLERVQSMLRKLNIAEKHLDESIFILQLFLMFQRNE